MPEIDVAGRREANYQYWRRRLLINLVRLAVVGGFLLLWELSAGRWIEPFLISSPSRIYASLVSNIRSGVLLQHAWVTFQEIGLGFPIGAILGVTVGYLFGRSRTLAEIFEPIIIAIYGND